MSQLAASANGRLALVSCGACEALVDVMLQSQQNEMHSVHGCQKRSTMCEREKCECDELCCHFHRCYVCAALALDGCAAGAYTLNRLTCWNPNWQVLVDKEQTRMYVEETDTHYSCFVEDEVIKELKRQSMTLPPVVVHFENHWYTHTGSPRFDPCHCALLESGCPLAEPALLEVPPAQAADEEDEMGSNALWLRFE